jgi:glyoxylase-like metal-dependent hydrolase (beta-lactamase superfamily II)
MVGEKCWEKRYEYAIVQTGSLPLNPEADYEPSREHRCTSALIWPEGANPSHQNAVLTDPCFTLQGYQQAVQQFEQLKCSFQEIGWIFVTHPHRDHLSNLTHFIGRQPDQTFRPDTDEHLKGFVSTPLPGHFPTQKGLFFCSASQHVVCVSGDAILDEAWLRAWKYYWPNFYQEADILQTWNSVAIILARADVIIPGHGAPFQVTGDLLDHLVHTFDQAEHAEQCPQVCDALKNRLEVLKD